MLRNFDLRQKRVIDVDTAEVVGYIRDMDVDFESGRINSVTIPNKGIGGLFSKSRSVTIPWDSVLAIGSEFVIIKQRERNITNIEK